MTTKQKLDELMGDIKKEYALYPTVWLARKYNVAVPTMRNFLSRNKIYKEDCRRKYIKEA